MRYLLAASLLALPATLPAQTPSPADSALVLRILTAEDRRDSTDTSLSEGLESRDARIRVIAQRARWRIRDPKFKARDSLPPLPAPKSWPEPEWRARWRALTDKSTCEELGAAIQRREWPVSLRAMDLESARCNADRATIGMLSILTGVSRTATRESGQASWQPAGHAIVALARMDTSSASGKIGAVAGSPNWGARVYAAHAAGILADTPRLVRMTKDADDNVKEAAVEELSKLTGHANDSVYLAVLNAENAQAVRAAAIALKGSPRAYVKAAANTTFDAWVARNVASARDVRVALLGAADRPVSDDKPPQLDTRVPAEAVALAFGKDVRLRVTMQQRSGGGSFVVKLRGDIAPIMAAKILQLAQAQYYDGGIWHRVEHDFVIQGAGPGNFGGRGPTPPPNEYVGAKSFLRDELGNVPHSRGTIGMSTRSHDTGDAQWFVNVRDNLRLGPDYTVVAEVVEGMQVVDGVLQGDVIDSIRVVR